ncbi:MAG: flagellar hook-basal body protein [Deltaproteobacteria bacterium]|nr:flagellar hook-basal body protein [Deltaproteobacteria bacterium]
MERGTYVAASGGLLELRKLDVASNNLANINTVGFKRQILVGETQDFEQTLASTIAASDPYARGDHERSPGTVNVRAATDFTPGPIKNTGNKWDVAARNPNDFFVVQTPDGPQYTRAGNFTLNDQGQLVTLDGFPVQGDGGTVTADVPGAYIAPDGSIRAGNEVLATLQVVRFVNPESLERVGMTRFITKPGQPAPEPVEPDVMPQALEMSNVSATSSVIELITANRAFDMYTKTAQAIDQMNQTAVTQVGRGR